MFTDIESGLVSFSELSNLLSIVRGRVKARSASLIQLKHDAISWLQAEAGFLHPHRRYYLLNKIPLPPGGTSLRTSPSMPSIIRYALLTLGDVFIKIFAARRCRERDRVVS